MSSLLPVVSVVIPTRDRVQMLVDAVDSVRRQSGVAWELVVVDDASSDGTKAYLAEQEDIRVVSFPQHRERSAARNAGLDMTRGRFVLFLDSDDRLAPGGLATLVRAACRRTDIVVVGGWKQLSGSLDAIQPLGVRKHSRASWRDVLFGWSPQVGQMLIPRHVALSSGGFDESLSFAEDIDFALRLTYAGDVVVVPDVTLEYRSHPGQSRPAEATDIDARVRRRFVESLDPHDHAVGNRILSARANYLEAREHLATERYRAMAAAILRAIVRAPQLLRSRVIGSYLVRLAFKAVAASVLPQRFVKRRRPRAR